MMLAKTPAAPRPSAPDASSLCENHLRTIKAGVRTNTDEIVCWREIGATSVGGYRVCAHDQTATGTELEFSQGNSRGARDVCVRKANSRFDQIESDQRLKIHCRKRGRVERPNSSSIPDQFHIYYSKRKIFVVILRGLILIALFAAIFRASVSDWQLEAPLSRISRAELAFLLLLLVTLLWWFIYRPLRQLSKLSTPVDTMSRDGIALQGRPPMPWRTIKGNYFQRIGYGGLTVYSVIRIKTSSATFPKAILSDTLEISRDEYEKQSRLYASRA
jgi:hypothetical protein